MVFDDMALGEFLIREELLTREQVTRGIEAQTRLLRRGAHVPGLVQALAAEDELADELQAAIAEALERATLTCQRCGEANVILSRRRAFVCRCGERFSFGEADESAERPAGGLPDVGAAFGPFALEERLGHGAYGMVYRARDSRDGGEVAVKILRRDADTERLDREVSSVRRLAHPLLVTIREHGRIDGWDYLVMECIPGPSLAQVIREAPPGDPQTLRRVVGYLVQVCEAMHSAHREGIVHRDLKPANILLDALDRPRLVDFGLSLDVHSGQCDEPGGTPAFMAPEQVRAKALGPGVDIWALGVILYRVASGKLPFRGQRLVEVYFRVLKDEPRYRELPQDASLRTIIAQCLAKRPEARYDDARTLARDLRRWLAGKPVRGRPRRRSFGVLWQLAIVAVAALLFAGSLWLVRERRAERVRAAEVAALRQYPAELRAGLAQVRGLHALGRRREALASYAELAAAHPTQLERAAALGIGGDSLRALAGELALVQGGLAGADLAEARAAFRRAAARLPGDPRPLLAEARVLLAIGRDGDARRLLGQVLAERPEEPEARLLRGRLLWYGQELDAARRDYYAVAYGEGIDDELRAEAHHALGRLEGGLGLVGPMVSSYEAAARLPSRRRAVYLAELGRALRLFGLLPGDARPSLEAALRLGLESPVPHRELALLAYEEGDVAEARRMVEIALALAPFDPPSLVLRARLRESYGEVEGGVADYKAALQAEQDGRGPEGDLFQRARFARDPDRKTLLSWLLTLCPEHVGARVARAELLRLQGELDEALRLGTEAFEHNPMAFPSYALVGKIYLQQAGAGNLQRAEFLLGLAVERGDQNLTTFLARARARELLGKTEAALGDFRYVLKNNPWNQEALAGERRLAPED